MKHLKIRLMLVLYDLFILFVADYLVFDLLQAYQKATPEVIIPNMLLSMVCIFGARFIGKVYKQVWRYGGIQCYIRLLTVDGVAFLINLLLSYVLPIERVIVARQLAAACMNLLGALAIRMLYRYAYKCANGREAKGKFLYFLLKVFARRVAVKRDVNDQYKTKIAIVGAGSMGVALAEELRSNKNSAYIPRCYIDVNKDKVDKTIHGISVLPESEATFERLREHEVQEVVFAVPTLEEEDKKRLYDYYTQFGFKIKVYDYPMTQLSGGKRQLRDFDIEELLFREPVVMEDSKTNLYYSGKKILITGGGGSIGSELCRQLAKMSPAQIIILDIYENGAYEVQQELKITYGDSIDIKIEITSITNERAMSAVFERYKPDIVINAAAHKHVPLMEHNCIEAIENNVFGTKILVDLCEAYGAERFMMVSTDKAVNPTNVMGATKRMCEMMVLGASSAGKVKYSATRFGNVLGSAGSVIPLFKKQIASGGPITITDKRIIRYFMTIPEASRLVLQSGAIADNGELFVLDMGSPVRIVDLAESMIRLSGVAGIEIVETGLRPGEKLYEELLIKKEDLDKTENNLIYIEREESILIEEVAEKLRVLREACDSGDEEKAKAALKQVVPTYRTPEEINSTAEESEEMKSTLEAVATV